MPKFNDYVLPELPVSQYPYALISVAGDTAYLAFTDKIGYVETVDTGYNIYTLGLTVLDEHDESKIIYAERYSAKVSEADEGSWTEIPWDDPIGIYTLPEGAYYSLSVETGPHWSNVDLCDANDNLFIRGTEIVYSDLNLKNWLIGYALGLAGKPLPMRVATAYLYNGIQLPGLPAWSRSTYPYAYIHFVSGEYCFIVCTVRMEKTKNAFTPTDESACGWSHWYCRDGIWVEGAQGSQGSWSAPEILWSNMDIFDTAGNVVLAGSEPIPVYGGSV